MSVWKKLDEIKTNEAPVSVGFGATEREVTDVIVDSLFASENFPGEEEPISENSFLLEFHAGVNRTYSGWGERYPNNVSRYLLQYPGKFRVTVEKVS